MKKLKIHPSVSFPVSYHLSNGKKSFTLYLQAAVFMSTVLPPFLLHSPFIFSKIKENTH